jgi:hypothetical protein
MEIQIPYTISGKLLADFINKSELYKGLDRQIVRDSLKNNKLRNLNFLGYKQLMAKKIKDGFLKQGVKHIFIYGPILALAYFFNNWTDLPNTLQHHQPQNPVVISQQISENLSAIFDSIDPQMEWHNTLLYYKIIDEFKMNIHQNLVHQLESSEEMLKQYRQGEPDQTLIKYIKANEDFSYLKIVKPMDLITKIQPASQLEHIIYHYPSQNSFVLITRTFSKLKPNQMIFESHISISADKLPQLYNGLYKSVFKPSILSTYSESSP